MNKFRSSSTNHFSFSFHLTFHHPFSQRLCYPYLTQPYQTPYNPTTNQPTNQNRPDTLWFPKAVILAFRRRWATAAAPFLCRCWFKACCRASEVAASLQMACKPREPKRLSCAPVMVEGRRTSPSQKKKAEAWFFRVGGKRWVFFSNFPFSFSSSWLLKRTGGWSVVVLASYQFLWTMCSFPSRLNAP